MSKIFGSIWLINIKQGIQKADHWRMRAGHQENLDLKALCMTESYPR